MNSAQFAERLGVTKDNIHDWRRRGFLDGIGAAGVNRAAGYSYSEADVAIMKVAIEAWRSVTLADHVRDAKAKLSAPRPKDWQEAISELMVGRAA